MRTIQIQIRHPSILIVSLFILAALLGACGGQQIPQTGSEPPVVNLGLTDSAITAPSTAASAGITTILVENTGQVDRGVFLARLNTDVTMDQFLSRMAEDEIQALGLATMVGGREVLAGRTEQVILDLKEGTHVVMAFPENVDGPPLTGSFPVGPAGESQGSPPSADVTVDMGDFAFVMPDTVPAGSATWEVVNSGQQWHEMILLRPDEGYTQEQFKELLASPQEIPDDPPFKQAGGFAPISPGEHGWILLDLAPGRYWAVCFLPDVESRSHLAHVEKGMFKEFVVE